MRLLLQYAKLCNMHVVDLMHHLQQDSSAREKFEAWKAAQ